MQMNIHDVTRVTTRENKSIDGGTIWLEIYITTASEGTVNLVLFGENHDCVTVEAEKGDNV